MENINFRILPTAFRYLAGFFRQNVFSQVQRPRAALERLHRSAPEPADDPPAYRPPKKVPPLATSREDTVRNRSSTRLPTATGGSRAQAANTAVTKTALRNKPRKEWGPRRVTEMGAVAQGVTENGRRGTGMRATAAFLATPRATAALFVTRRATAGFLATHSAMAATVATPLGGIVDCADYGIRLHSGAKKETRAAFSLVDAKSIKVYRSLSKYIGRAGGAGGRVIGGT